MTKISSCRRIVRLPHCHISSFTSCCLRYVKIYIVKRYFFYSLFLHLILIIVAFIIIRAQPDKTPAPFVATIVTPEELQEKEHIEMPQIPRGRIPRNLQAPEKLSAIPSSPAPVRKSKATTTEKRSAPSDAGDSQAHAPESNTFQLKTSEPMPKQDERGMAEEQQRPIKGNRSGDYSQAGRRSPSARTPHEKLFDSDIIAKLTPKESEGAKSDNGITFDTKEYKYYGYMQRLREKIEGIWKYPAEAAERKINGELYIRFTIKKNGRLAAVELVHTSGYEILDDAALRALRDADPYWPLPDSWNQDSLTITGHFVYYFHNTFIR
jgi:protein TonB